MAEHYGTVILPARAGKPKDKAKVESAVLNAERRILAVLRHQRFFSLAEANRAIGQALEELNRRPFKKLPGNRVESFQALDKPVLKPLPPQRYELAQWLKAKVNIDYHVQIDNHLYSVPYRLVNQPVEARLRARSVEIFHRGQRVAIHPRSPLRGRFSTDPAHRPKSHQRHLQWTPGRLIKWAGTLGDQCRGVVEEILRSRPHPEQGYRSCLGLMRLARRYGPGRMEAACRRALATGACSYRSIKSMLETGMDSQPLPSGELGPEALEHTNLRGRNYYQ
jgi:transposase